MLNSKMRVETEDISSKQIFSFEWMTLRIQVNQKKMQMKAPV